MASARRLRSSHTDAEDHADALVSHHSVGHCLLLVRPHAAPSGHILDRTASGLRSTALGLSSGSRLIRGAARVEQTLVREGSLPPGPPRISGPTRVTALTEFGCRRPWTARPSDTACMENTRSPFVAEPLEAVRAALLRLTQRSRPSVGPLLPPVTWWLRTWLRHDARALA